ncbi:MAG TPA: adenylosuccinate synthetase [Candidatus Saccharimonadales bacterium]
MSVDVLVGSQRGDEGKGRFVDILAAEYDAVARYNGGNNAGHTVVLEGYDEPLKLHLVPSGIAHEGTVNIIGNGTLVNPVQLVAEIAHIRSFGLEVSEDNLKISSGAHLIMPHHIWDDKIRETDPGIAQGSTKTGIAPTMADKSMRLGKRVEEIRNRPDELFDIAYSALVAQRELRDEAGFKPIDEAAEAREFIEAALSIGCYVTDTVRFLGRSLERYPDLRVLAEGAQAFALDIDHGMYPFTTSTSTTSGGATIGLGVPASRIGKVFGVVKAVPSHVGGGNFVTEIFNEEQLATLHGDKSAVDGERGTTTGRDRRLGHLDLPLIRRSNLVNGPDEIILTKLDWVQRFGPVIDVCVEYERKGKILEDAPDSARKLDQSRPIYVTLPGWEEDITGARSFSDLPKAAQYYVDFLEYELRTPITMIGVGAQPDEYIDRR